VTPPRVDFLVDNCGWAYVRLGDRIEYHPGIPLACAAPPCLPAMRLESKKRGSYGACETDIKFNDDLTLAALPHGVHEFAGGIETSVSFRAGRFIGKELFVYGNPRNLGISRSAPAY